MCNTTECGKFLEIRVPDHLTCLLRNLFGGQEGTVRIYIEQLTGSQLEKEYNKAAYCHPVDLRYMQSAAAWSVSRVQLFVNSDYSPPVSSVHGVLLTRILEWVAIPSSKGPSQSRSQTRVFHIVGRFHTI